MNKGRDQGQKEIIVQNQYEALSMETNQTDEPVNEKELGVDPQQKQGNTQVHESSNNQRKQVVDDIEIVEASPGMRPHAERVNSARKEDQGTQLGEKGVEDEGGVAEIMRGSRTKKT
ncbi:hypothetical protein HAX54_022926 [Datura stramonium]|uniref:Uncharacterized protein n=1 Tax=Datura stramonium TaxID=4076 RepID=A0ABS8UY81_DATST|nr:hypothetical protein [Datura stramonium]